MYIYIIQTILVLKYDAKEGTNSYYKMNIERFIILIDDIQLLREAEMIIHNEKSMILQYFFNCDISIGIYYLYLLQVCYYWYALKGKLK